MPYYPAPTPLGIDDVPRHIESEFYRISATIEQIIGESVIPKAALRLSAPLNNVNVGDTYQPLTVFDTILLSRGGVTAVADQITVSQAANYEISIGLNVSVKQTEQLDLMMTINGTNAHSEALGIQGLGSNDKPNAITWTSNVNLLAGDVIAWNIRNGDPGTMSVDFVRATFSARRD